MSGMAEKMTNQKTKDITIQRLNEIIANQRFTKEKDAEHNYWININRLIKHLKFYQKEV